MARESEKSEQNMQNRAEKSKAANTQPAQQGAAMQLKIKIHQIAKKAATIRPDSTYQTGHKPRLPVASMSE
jgi:hypothetical protein